MLSDLTALELAVTLVSVVAGALVQGTIGIGFGIVVVPVLALVAPAALPAVPLVIAMPLVALISYRERHAVDRRGLPRLLVGRVLGTAAAVGLLVALSDAALEMLFGLVVLAVVALSLLRAEVRPTPTAQLLAGTASGLFATTAAIGGPPAALLYQSRPGPEVRATLSLLFLLGGLISLAGLVLAGRLSLAHLGLAALLAPAMVAGFALSRPLGRRVDTGWLRPGVLLFAGAAGVLAVVRGLTG